MRRQPLDAKSLPQFGFSRLPHAVRCNAGAAPDAMVRLSRAFASHDPAGCLSDLASLLGASTALRDFGMPEEDIGRLIADAWAGMRP